MENKEKKFFTKFDDSINKEKIFIRLMNYNYKILCQKWYENPVKAKKLEQERDEFYREAKEMGKEYLEYLKYSLKEVLEQDIELKKVKSEENKQLLKENKFLKKYYAFWIDYYTNEFDYLLKAHISFIKNGEVVPFDEFDEDVKEHVSFECGFDVYLNLSQFHFLGHTLADIYYRSKKIKHDLPIFMTKYEDKLFSDTIEKHFEFVERFPEYTDINSVREIYNREELIEKRLYESVFPEFGFKYEDRESECMDVYTMDFPQYNI